MYGRRPMATSTTSASSALGGAAGGRFDRDLQRLARGVDGRDLARQAEGDALLAEDALGLPGDLAVDAGQDAVEELDHGHLAAEPPPDRAEFEADDAGADDDEAPRHAGERQRAGRRDDALLVDLDAAERRRVRAGGDDDRLRLDDLARFRRPWRPTPCPARRSSRWPRKESILFFLKRKATPETLASTTASLCAIICGRSSFGLPTLMPKPAKLWPASSKSSEVWRSAFDGMQPTLRQVPPKVASFSMTATLRPSWAARMAQT